MLTLDCGPAWRKVLNMTELLPPIQASLQNEMIWRARVYERLVTSYEDGMIPPQDLRDLRVYGGAAGLWCDRARTIDIVGTGLCVALLHTGRHYNDSMVGDVVIYHYPDTERAENADANEIEAARTCLTLRMPVFVILPGRSAGTRAVRLGWIVADMSDEKAFFLRMADEDPGRIGFGAR